MTAFFPDSDTSQEPQVSNTSRKSWILNTVGLCLKNLGRLSEAGQFYKRKTKMQLEIEDWENASRGYKNLAELYTSLGRLEKSSSAAAEALQLARRVESKSEEKHSLKWVAWVAHLHGDIETAGAVFQQAESLEEVRYLYSLNGILHADQLRRVGKADYARQVTEANLEISESNHFTFSIAMCQRVLGDLAADAGDHERAGQHYEAALKIARSITLQDVLIEALLARGRWLAKKTNEGSKPSQGYKDLNEALDYALQGGYRIYEVDIRVALAWAHRASGNLAAAKTEAQRALTMSEEMGYHWGKVDAEEVLEKLRAIKRAIR